METKKQEQLEPLDLIPLIRSVFKQLKQLWVMVLVLMLLGGGLMYFRTVSSYRPMYKSEAVFSVSISYTGETDVGSYSNYYDQAAAQLVTDTFPYLVNSDVMTERLNQVLEGGVNGNITATSMAGTNMFRLTVISPDPEAAYNIIRAVMDIYPQISKIVIGDTQLAIAREPQLPTAPYNAFGWRRNVLLGALAGLALGVLILLCRAALTKTVTSAEDVKKLANLTCLASVPEVPVKRRNKRQINQMLITHQEPDSSFCETFRLLKLRLQRLLDESGGKVLLFTSSLPSEGKSSLSTNVALSLAQDNKKVLLIDGDLRVQGLKKLLGYEGKSTGLGDLLSGKVDELILSSIMDENLYLIAGEESIPNPAHLLRFNQLNSVIETLRPQFDYIIIDTPPCGMMSDAAKLSRHADMVIYVIREDYASQVQIQDGIQILSENGAKIGGFVLNRTAQKSSSGYGYGYGYGHGYGYGYGYGREHGYGHSPEQKPVSSSRSSGRSQSSGRSHADRSHHHSSGSRMSR